MCAAAACFAYSSPLQTLLTPPERVSSRNIAEELSDIGERVFKAVQNRLTSRENPELGSLCRRIGSTEITINDRPTIVGVYTVQHIRSSLVRDQGRFYTKLTAHHPIKFFLSQDDSTDTPIGSFELSTHRYSSTFIRWDADPKSINATFIANNGAMVEQKIHLSDLHVPPGENYRAVMEKLVQLAVEIFNRSNNTTLVNLCVGNGIDWESLGFVFNRARSQAALVKNIAIKPPPPFDTVITISEGSTSYGELIARSSMVDGSGDVIPAEPPMALVEI